MELQTEKLLRQRNLCDIGVEGFSRENMIEMYFENFGTEVQHFLENIYMCASSVLGICSIDFDWSGLIFLGFHKIKNDIYLLI